MKMELGAQGAVRRHRRRRSAPDRRPGRARRDAVRRARRRPMSDAHRRTGRRAAGAGHDLRGRPARRPAERVGAGADRGQGRVHPAAGRRRAADRRGDQLRAPEVGAAARRRRRADGRCSATAGRGPARCWCPTSAASTGRSSSACRHIAIFGCATETFAQQQPQPQPRRAVRDVRADRAPRPRRRARRPRLRLDVLRRPVGGRGADRAGRRRSASGSSTSAPASSASATRSASAPPATSRALLAAFVDAGHGRRPARDALPRHLRPGARQRLRRAPGRASRRSTPAPAASAAAPTPRAPPATSPPRTWSGCCTASASRPASTSTQVVATSVWMAGHLGRPEPVGRGRAATGVTRSATAAQSGRMSRRRLPAHRCAEDRHDLPPGPAHPQRQDARRARRPLPAPVAAGQPRAVPLPRRPRPARPGLGRRARPRATAAGTRWSGGSRRRVRHGRRSATRSSRRPSRPRRAGDGRPRRQRDPRRLLRPRPRPAAAGRLAGEHQAGPQVDVHASSSTAAENGRPWFVRAFDLPTVLGTWGADLPPEQVHVVTVPHAGVAAARRAAVAAVLPGVRHRPGLGAARTATAPTAPSASPRRSCIRQLNRRLDRRTRARGGVRRPDPRACSPRTSWSSTHVARGAAAARRASTGSSRAASAGSTGCARAPAWTSSATSTTCVRCGPTPTRPWHDPDRVSPRKRRSRPPSTRWRR